MRGWKAKIASNDPPYVILLCKDRLAFTEHFTAAIHSSNLFDDILVRLPCLMAGDEMQTFHLSTYLRPFDSKVRRSQCLMNQGRSGSGCIRSGSP
ncbi:hypothetical protein BDR07DRAFT_1404957 [Suillus spraguei]|nr:hypothetical protein BDR07DRAFT_1404957 [Suillus spraguei]